MTSLNAHGKPEGSENKGSRPDKSPPDSQSSKTSDADNQKPSPLPSGEFRDFKVDIIASYKQNLKQYASTFKSLSKKPALDALLEETPDEITHGRSLLQMAMDDVAIGFADAMQDLDEDKWPVELYQSLLRVRDNKKVSKKDALTDLKERITHARSLDGPNNENTEFFTLLWTEIPPQGTAPLINLRAAILDAATKYTYPEEVINTLNNYKQSAGLLAQEFQKQVKQGKPGKGPKRRPGGMPPSAPSKIDLDFGSKTDNGPSDTSSANTNREMNSATSDIRITLDFGGSARKNDNAAENSDAPANDEARHQPPLKSARMEP